MTARDRIAQGAWALSFKIFAAVAFGAVAVITDRPMTLNRVAWQPSPMPHPTTAPAPAETPLSGWWVLAIVAGVLLIIGVPEVVSALRGGAEPYEPGDDIVTPAGGDLPRAER